MSRNTADNCIHNNISTALKQPGSLGFIPSGMFSSRSRQPFRLLLTHHDFSFAFWILCGHNWDCEWLRPTGTRKTESRLGKWGQVVGSWKTHLLMFEAYCLLWSVLTSKFLVPRPRRQALVKQGDFLTLHTFMIASLLTVEELLH